MMREVEEILSRYDLTDDEQKLLLDIMKPIVSHKEFQRRMTKEFMHHSDISLGEHIICDTVVTYLLSKKYLKKHNYNIELALKISMLHDLYTMSWQNNPLGKMQHFRNSHAFRHPIEAVINSITWYPDIFENKSDAKIIIDGIIHHMHPLPSKSIDDMLELSNMEVYKKLPKEYIDMIRESANRKKLLRMSFAKSLYREGRVMSKADKNVSIKQIKNFSSFKALLTGKNKSIE